MEILIFFGIFFIFLILKIDTKRNDSLEDLGNSKESFNSITTDVLSKAIFDIQYDPDRLNPEDFHLNFKDLIEHSIISNISIGSLGINKKGWILERRLIIQETKYKGKTSPGKNKFDIIPNLSLSVRKNKDYSINPISIKFNIRPDLINVERDKIIYHPDNYDASSVENISLELDENQKTLVSGSGVLVSQTGIVVTNYHVVKNSNEVSIVFPHFEKNLETRVISKDVKNDIAILKIVNYSHLDVFNNEAIPYSLNNELSYSPGEKIYTIGYPISFILGNEPSITDGRITRSVGMNDDPTLIQHNCAIQPGNSGGPIFSDKGEFVGIIVGSVNDQLVAPATGAITQNINFGIKVDYILNILKNLKISVSSEPTDLEGMELSEQMELMRKFCCQILTK